MIKLSNEEIFELKKLIKIISQDGLSLALSKSMPNLAQYPRFLPLQNLSVDDAETWLLAVMRDYKLVFE